MTNHPNRSKREKSAHSPGPWFLGHLYKDGNQAVLFKYNGQDTRIADVPDADDKEQQANARLIAAAPELLEALSFGGIGFDTIILLHNAAGVLAEYGHTELAEGLIAKGLAEYAAIAKATGQ